MSSSEESVFEFSDVQDYTEDPSEFKSITRFRGMNVGVTMTTS